MDDDLWTFGEAKEAFRAEVKGLLRAVLGKHFSLRKTRDEEDRSTRYVFWFSRGDVAEDEIDFSARLTVNYPSKFAMAKVTLTPGDDDDVLLSLALPPVALWAAFDLPRALRVLIPDGRHVTGVAVHDAALWWDVWNDDHCHRSTDPWWQQGCFHFDDFLLGEAKYTSCVELGEEEVTLRFAEGNYRAKVEFTKDTWKRPRWPFAKVLRLAKVTPDLPIPTPGKGESSWDCGEDASFSMSMPARNAEDAAAIYMGSVESRRRRYGGKGWLPEAVRKDLNSAVSWGLGKDGQDEFHKATCEVCPPQQNGYSLSSSMPERVAARWTCPHGKLFPLPPPNAADQETVRRACGGYRGAARMDANPHDIEMKKAELEARAALGERVALGPSLDTLSKHPLDESRKTAKSPISIPLGNSEYKSETNPHASQLCLECPPLTSVPRTGLVICRHGKAVRIELTPEAKS